MKKTKLKGVDAIDIMFKNDIFEDFIILKGKEGEKYKHINFTGYIENIDKNIENIVWYGNKNFKGILNELSNELSNEYFIDDINHWLELIDKERLSNDDKKDFILYVGEENYRKINIYILNKHKDIMCFYSVTQKTNIFNQMRDGFYIHPDYNYIKVKRINCLNNEIILTKKENFVFYFNHDINVYKININEKSEFKATCQMRLDFLDKTLIKCKSKKNN